MMYKLVSILFFIALFAFISYSALYMIDYIEFSKEIFAMLIIALMGSFSFLAIIGIITEV